MTPSERTELDRLIPGRYHASGYLSDEELNREYNRSRCLAYPSLYEGFGIPVLEAMRAGCPVIAVNASSIPEVAGTAAFLLERGHPDEICAAIERLLNAEQFSALVASGKVRAEGFGWQATYERMVGEYRDLLGHAID